MNTVSDIGTHKILINAHKHHQVLSSVRQNTLYSVSSQTCHLGRLKKKYKKNTKENDK